MTPRAALLVAVLLSTAWAAEFDENYIETEDTDDAVPLQGAVATNGLTAFATSHHAYVMRADESQPCKPALDKVIPLPEKAKNAKVMVLYPREDTLRIYACTNEPKYFGLWIYDYTSGAWHLDEKNTIDNTIWWDEDVDDWQGLQMVDSTGYGSVEDGWYAVLVDKQRISVMVFRDELVHSGQWGGWFFIADRWNFSDLPRHGYAPTGAAFTFGGTTAVQKTGVSMMLLVATELEHSTHPGYEHDSISSFYVSPPQCVLMNADTLVGGLREFFWLQEIDGESLALHWIGDEGKWFGDSPGDSLRTLAIDTRGHAWGTMGRHFPVRRGEYDAESVAIVFSGGKTSTRVHALQFVRSGSGAGYEILESATHDLATPLPTSAAFWPSAGCPRALLVPARTAHGHLRPTVVSVRGVDDGAAMRHARSGVPHRHVAMHGEATSAPRGIERWLSGALDSEWCYSQATCTCPAGANAVPPCGPTTCCGVLGNSCYQVANGRSTNCCSVTPFVGCRELATPCTSR